MMKITALAVMGSFVCFVSITEAQSCAQELAHNKKQKYAQVDACYKYHPAWAQHKCVDLANNWDTHIYNVERICKIRGYDSAWESISCGHLQIDANRYLEKTITFCEAHTGEKDCPGIVEDAKELRAEVFESCN